MKKILIPIAIAAFSYVLAEAETSQSARNQQWGKIENPGNIVPAVGEYAVLVSAGTLKNPEWKAVADKIATEYKGKIISWNGDIYSSLSELQKLKPRYVAVVAQPEEIDRVVVAKIHRLSREIDPDFFGDAIFGIITGGNAKIAQRLAEAEKPLVMTRGFGTTNFDQQRFRTSFFITDWGPNEYIETNDYISSSKVSVPAGTEMIDIFADRWEKIQPHYVLTSSHATEFNLEMPFSKGLIASAGDKFYCFNAPQLGLYVRNIGNVPAVEKVATEHKLKTLSKSENPKVWIAAGNCLFGDTLRTKNSMVVTAITAMNVKQFVGYTVPSWFGEGGWGTHGAFFNNHQDTTVGQAWFFNNQEILSRLPEALRAVELPLNPSGMSGIQIGRIAGIISSKEIQPTQQLIGRVHDKDVVAFYGNPLFRAQFDQTAKSLQPWKYELFSRGNARKIIVTGTQGKSHKGKFNFWFPRVCDTKKGVSVKIVRDGNASENISADSIAFTKNFVMLKQDVELAPGDFLEILYTQK